MKNFINRFALFVGLYLGITNLAFAGGTQTGKVVHLTLRGSDGLVLIDLDGPVSDKPICARYLYWIIKDETSLIGKQQLALLLTAKATGQTIAISGTGTCTRWHDGEDIDAIQLQ